MNRFLEKASKMMIGLGVPALPGVPAEVYVWLIRALIAWPVAYYAKKKGYNFWVFFVAGVLLSPLTCLALAIALPKIVRYVGKREAEALKGD